MTVWQLTEMLGRFDQDQRVCVECPNNGWQEFRQIRQVRSIRDVNFDDDRLYETTEILIRVW